MKKKEVILLEFTAPQLVHFTRLCSAIADNSTESIHLMKFPKEFRSVFAQQLSDDIITLNESVSFRDIARGNPSDLLKSVSLFHKKML